MLSRALALALALLLFAVPRPIHAGLYERDPYTPELGVELAFLLHDADRAFAELSPELLFGLSAGVHLLPDLRLGLVARAAIADPDAEHYELAADLTWSHVAEPRLPIPPALRVAASLELGYRHTTLHGSDFVATDDGLFAALGVELGLVVFQRTALSLQLTALTGDSSNAAFTPWAPKLRAGLTLSTLL